jgi:hypothetical protein
MPGLLFVGGGPPLTRQDHVWPILSHRPHQPRNACPFSAGFLPSPTVAQRHNCSAPVPPRSAGSEGRLVAALHPQPMQNGPRYGCVFGSTMLYAQDSEWVRRGSRVVEAKSVSISKTSGAPTGVGGSFCCVGRVQPLPGALNKNRRGFAAPSFTECATQVKGWSGW